MNQFVIIFRQRPYQFTEAELKTRAKETGAWAQIQNAAGHKLEPRMLAPESHRRDADGSSRPTPTTAEGPVTALLFLEAENMEQAIAIAQAHPALSYQASVEVRAWSPPNAPQ